MLLVTTVCVAWLIGQASPETPPPPVTPATATQAQSDPSKGIPISQLPPSLKLGVRAEMVRRQTPVAPVLVIVQDGPSYVAALSRWSLSARFPVLIDDGTFQTREHIARFARAFKPERVLRWSSGAAGGWVADEAQAMSVIGRAWGPDPKPEAGFDAAGVAAQWARVQFVPPGIVAAAKDDPAWVAGLALAAFRGQPMFWTTSSRKLDAAMTGIEAMRLDEELQKFAAASGRTWKSLGDDIDAVTLAMAVPQKVQEGSQLVATTDRIGRASATAAGAERWAWCGQIFGTHALASYRAMCSLFLQPSAAWLADGYPDKPGWSDFDATKAAEVVRAGGLTATVLDTPRGGERDWRASAAAPLDAGLVFVNSKGNKDFFDLQSGQGLLGDVPILRVPTMVHFVHSFSAQFVGGRDTIAARWLDRGAYAYLGSIDEPFLNAFVPTPQVAARVLLGMPWGAAVRHDSAPVWKLTVIGDPLTTFGPPAPRGKADAVVLPGATDLAELVKQHLKDRKLADALTMLAWLGRDEDAVRLAEALAAKPAELNADTAKAAAMPLFRAGKTDAFFEVVSVIPPADTPPEVRDALWLAAAGRLRGTTDSRLLNALRDNPRPEQVQRDMTELAAEWPRVFTRAAVLPMLESIRDAMPDAAKRAQADKVVEQFRQRSPR